MSNNAGEFMDNQQNNLTRQDYVDMMYEALKQFKYEDSTTINLMTKYLILQTENLDPEDESIIRLTVYNTFLSLKRSGYFKAKKFNEYKATRKNLSEIKLIVEDNDIIVKKRDLESEM